MNYLDLMNNVLRRLRANTVTGINQTAYSSTVGDLINDAKRQVEDSWDWSALRTSFVVATVSGTAQYSLTGTQNRATILDATNDTSQYFLSQRSQKWGRQRTLVDTSNGQPHYFTVDSPDSSGDTQVSLYSTPDGVYSCTFSLVQREADLSAEGDEVSIPHMPIVHLAHAFAARERGEVGGQTAAEIFSVAQRSLSDAIAYDSALNPTDLIYYEV